MRIISYISSIIITFFALAIMSGCKDSEVVDDGFRTTMAKASDVKLNKVAYWPGDPVNCSFTLKNETNYPMDIREVKVVIQNLDDGGCVLIEKSVASHIQIEPGQSVPVDAGTLYTLPAALKPSSFCAVRFLLDFEDGITTTIDGTYFRAVAVDLRYSKVRLSGTSCLSSDRRYECRVRCIKNDSCFRPGNSCHHGGGSAGWYLSGCAYSGVFATFRSQNC